MHNRKSYLAIITALLVVSISYANEKDYPYDYLYKNLPFEMPQVEKPVFPNRSVKLTDYGGVPDGITLNTNAFAEAINSLSEKGGGTLIVPSGIWYTGPIVFQSNINLHLERGALILFTTDREAYTLVDTNFEGRSARKARSPISGRNLENIAITGEGAINGSGEVWRPLKRAKVPDGHWKQVVGSGGILRDANYWVPSESAEYMRPVMVSLIECKNILLEGVLFENSPAWNIHPLLCENVIIDGIFIRNPSYAQNGDGLDIESCKNVIVINTTLDVGDDAICLKSGKDEQGRKRGRPTENVIVDNCRVFKGHGGFVVGSEMSGGVRNISVSNCQFMGTDVGLRFKSARGRGGVVENIFIKRINMFNIVNEPLLFDLYYFTRKTDDIPAVDETTPVFKDIFISDIVSRNSNKALFFNGLPEMNITNVRIENAFITSRLGAELSESENIQLKNVTVVPGEGAALILNNVKNAAFDHFSAPDHLETIVKITGNRNSRIQLPENMDKKKIVREENSSPLDWSVRMSESVMARYDSLVQSTRSPNKWQYDIAWLAGSIGALSDKTGDDKYFHYMKTYMDYYINADGTARYYTLDEYNLDRIRPAVNLFALWHKTGDEKYKTAIQNHIQQLKSHPRTSDGGYWHKKIYPYQMWLDGLFMAMPFAAQYGAEFNEPEWFDEAVHQITLVYRHTLDPKTGLLYHGWDESRKQSWSNPETGQSPNFWSRAMGWYMMAIVDVLDFLPVDHSGRPAVIDLLNRVSEALLKVRDPESYLWYQVTDAGNREGNYLEASGSGMFAYAFAKGALKGYLPSIYLDEAKKTHQSIVARLINTGDNGLVNLEQTCGGAGLGGNRDGSFEYYISERINRNDSKGVAAFISTGLLLK